MKTLLSPLWVKEREGKDGRGQEDGGTGRKGGGRGGRVSGFRGWV